MTNQERYQKYIKEHCKNCKNNKTNLCDIKIAVVDNIVQTKCVFYERDEENETEKKKKKAIQLG